MADGHTKSRNGEPMRIMKLQRPSIWDASKIQELVDFMITHEGQADEENLLTRAADQLTEKYYNCKAQWYRHNALKILRTQYTGPKGRPSAR